MPVETIFTDPVAAVEEAQWLANQNGSIYFVIDCGEHMRVIKFNEYHYIHNQKFPIIEKCSPIE